MAMTWTGGILLMQRRGNVRAATLWLFYRRDYFLGVPSAFRVSPFREGANKQVISSQADSLIKISRIWADFFPANNRISLFRLFFPPFLALFPVFTEIS
ncbi:TPA: hypothetical protein ACPTX6_005489, partial [Klebsiella pneumoniae]